MAPPVLVVCNMTPVPRHDYRIGVPRAGRWREIFNTRFGILRRHRMWAMTGDGRTR